MTKKATRKMPAQVKSNLRARSGTRSLRSKSVTTTETVRNALPAAPTIDTYADSIAGSVPRVPAATTADRTVVHPSHYNEHPTGIECIEINQHFNSNLGAAIKYIWRAGLKSPGKAGKMHDLRKAAEYIKFELDRIERFEQE